MTISSIYLCRRDKCHFLSYSISNAMVSHHMVTQSSEATKPKKT